MLRTVRASLGSPLRIRALHLMLRTLMCNAVVLQGDASCTPEAAWMTAQTEKVPQQSCSLVQWHRHLDQGQVRW